MEHINCHPHHNHNSYIQEQSTSGPADQPRPTHLSSNGPPNTGRLATSQHGTTKINDNIVTFNFLFVCLSSFWVQSVCSDWYDQWNAKWGLVVAHVITTFRLWTRAKFTHFNSHNRHFQVTWSTYKFISTVHTVTGIMNYKTAQSTTHKATTKIMCIELGR